MSVAPSTPTELARIAVGTTTKQSLALLAGAVRVSALWVAALLPLPYPLLLATGAVVDHPLVFAMLLVVNVVSLFLGHEHRA